jgi:hypothetical protein
VPALGEGGGDGVGVGADVGGAVTGGADGTDGEPLIKSVGLIEAEPAGADGAVLSCVLTGADGDPDDSPDDSPDGVAPA